MWGRPLACSRLSRRPVAGLGSFKLNRIGRIGPEPGASLKGMAKLKSARPKKADAPPVRGGLPCVIIVILGLILMMVFLYLVMSHAS